MFEVALYEPEIPPNTGNIIRLCANTGTQLHLIEPLGFQLDDKRMRRAGLDYKEWVDVQTHHDYTDFLQKIPQNRVVACSTKGQVYYHEFGFEAGDIILLGPETRGLPASVMNNLPKEQIIKIPMVTHSRSLNLSNATAIILYEAWRQLGFKGII